MIVPAIILLVPLLAIVATEPSAPSQPQLPPPPPRPTAVGTPFRLGLTYTRVLTEDGDLTNDQLSTNALGLVFISPSTTYVRNHFAIAHQWESLGAYSARGFRIDLISFGYPIHLWSSQLRLDLEPIFTAVRGEVLFVSGGGRFLRMEGGVGLELSATFRRWFVSLQPLAIDFRYWTYRSSAFTPQSQSGLGRVFPFRVALGYEF